MIGVGAGRAAAIFILRDKVTSRRSYEDGVLVFSRSQAVGQVSQ